MNAARIILTLMLFAVSAARGDQTARVVSVGGDVPKPGPVDFVDEGMTIDSAMARVGMDLSPYYARQRVDNDRSRCPIRIVVIRQGEKTAYNPAVDAAVMRALALKLNDTIVVTDFRQCPKKIDARRQRIDRMVEMGSTEIVDELLALATLQFEYDEWRSQPGAAPKGSDEYLKKEAARLVDGGKGQKVLDILDLKLSALQLEGLGHAHPVMKATTNLIEIFRNLIPK